MVFVTHDQVEAMTMADRIVVLKAGVVQQFGTPEEVYKTPANQFVAGFIGSPTMNFFDASATAGGLRLSDGTEFALPAARIEVLRRTPGAALVLGVRPEHMFVVAPGEAGLRVTVSVVEPLGSDTLMYFDRDGTRYVARVSPETQVKPGDAVTLGFATEKSHLFDQQDGSALR